MAKWNRSHKISEHFSKRDFVCKCGQCNDAVRISLGLVGGLELLRMKAKNRINILKGYECPDSAEKARRVKRNFHVQGVAADITVDNVSLEEAFKMAEEIPEFNGIGLNLDHNCLHVDTRKDKKRSIWVVQRDITIDVTDENRAMYQL